MSEERLSRARFIRLGAALGVGAASASVIAGCGGGGQQSGGGSQQATGAGASGETQGAGQGSGETSGGASQGAQGGAIASEGQVAPGTATNFKAPGTGDPAVLVHLKNGDFVAYSAVCTHAGCTVAYSNGQLACPCHGSVFDPAKGAAVVNGPANRPLPEIPVEVRDGQVYTA